MIHGLTRGLDSYHVQQKKRHGLCTIRQIFAADFNHPSDQLILSQQRLESDKIV